MLTLSLSLYSKSTEGLTKSNDPVLNEAFRCDFSPGLNLGRRVVR